MSTNPTELPEISSWRAHLLRLTAFPAGPDSIDTSDWWTQLTGTEPEEMSKKRDVTNYAGDFQGSELQLAVEPHRIQWLRIVKVDPSVGLEGGIPDVGRLPSSIEEFSSLMEPWLRAGPRLKRLALGAVLLHDVDSRQEGYRMLDRYLPFVELADDASDFLFKINRSRDSQTGIPRLQVNRLMSWSVFSWQAHSLVVSVRNGSPPVEVGQQAVGEQGFACRLEVDVNTSQQFSNELPEEGLIDVWQELVQLACEIAAEGDKP